MLWRCGAHVFDCTRSIVMGVLNVTPDSFSDGGLWAGPDAAVAHGLELAAAGAAIVDVGGESTRPGAEPVALEEEMRRVVPVVGRLVDAGLCVSVDTRRAPVASAAIEAGASIVNDVTAASDRDMFAVVRGGDAGVVLMHMKGEPRSMQDAPHYVDVVGEVAAYLEGRVEAAASSGVDREAVAVDPGFGFGKTAEHNLALLAATDRLAALGRPLVIGTSRKSMFAVLAGLGVRERVEATLATTVWTLLAGATIVRVHDVEEAVQAVAVVDGARGFW